jgi:hypothetical protein
MPKKGRVVATIAWMVTIVALALAYVVVALMLAGCQGDAGPVGSTRMACIDQPKGAPVASACQEVE